ncbi:hypothetical protein H7U22_10875 [Pedobacter sp. CCM 8938]|uniref:Uncharacterized protein n=2 Tax=Pedobacter fastidiosus TaxID=2765361 RepID=A0ABR7KSC7_9SPHI|nr:hypothetical protein [Pedobacter fastidiosus]MBC6110926.1 hypothetical protein [Pedobacter fastidiosus]
MTVFSVSLRLPTTIPVGRFNAAQITELYQKYSDAVYGNILLLLIFREISEKTLENTFIELNLSHTKYCLKSCSDFTFINRIARKHCMEIIRTNALLD